MNRTFTTRLAYTFFRHAASEKYPTRSVEHMLAWMIVVWGVALAVPGVNMQGPTFRYSSPSRRNGGGL